MGVKGLWDFLAPAGRRVGLETLSGRWVAVDASVWLTQLVRAMREADTMRLVRNAHLLGIFRRCCKLLYYGVDAVFVFDGAVPALKRRTQDRRRRRRDRQAARLRRVAERLLLLRLHRERGKAERREVAEEGDAATGSVLEQAVQDAGEEEVLPEGGMAAVEEEEEEAETPLQVPGVDEVDWEAVASYPASMQKEIIAELVRRINMETYGAAEQEETERDPSAFSQLQMDRFLRATELKMRVRNARSQLQERDMNGRRIASDTTREYVLIKEGGSGVRETVQSAPEATPRVPAAPLEYDSGTGWASVVQPHGLFAAAGEYLASEGNARPSGNRRDMTMGASSGGAVPTKAAVPPEPRPSPSVSPAGKSPVEVDDDDVDEYADIAWSDGEAVVRERVAEDVEAVSERGMEEHDVRLAEDESEVPAPPRSSSRESEVSIAHESEDAPAAEQWSPARPTEMEVRPQPETAPSLSDAEKSSETPDNNDIIVVDGARDVSTEDAVVVGHGVPSPTRSETEPDTRDLHDPTPSVSPAAPVTDRSDHALSPEAASARAADARASATSAVSAPPSSPPDEADADADADLPLDEAQLRAQWQSLSKQTDSISNEMVLEVRQMLSLLGIPFMQAPAEAEAQCAHLNAVGAVDAVVTEDSDAFLFGARRVYRHIFEESKYVEEYDMAVVERDMGMDRDRLICMALLLGGDYTDGIYGVGIVNATEIVDAFCDAASASPAERDAFSASHGLQSFRAWMEAVDTEEPAATKKKRQPSESEDKRERFQRVHRNVRRTWHLRDRSFPNRHVIDAYCHPNVERRWVLPDGRRAFAWREPDVAGLEAFCADKFGWDAARAREMLQPVLQAWRACRLKQMRIDAYFHPHRFARIRSQRLQTAVREMAYGHAARQTGEGERREKGAVEEVPLLAGTEEMMLPAVAPVKRRRKTTR